MNKKILSGLFLLLAFAAHAQISLDSVFVLPDSVKPFSLDGMYAAMLEYHPVVKQAYLLNETARQEIRMARGAFDPKVQADLNIKEFKDKEYYNKFKTSLSIPTWFPLDPKIGFERNTGQFIDPENVIGTAMDNSQLTTGVSLPLGRGLFTDDRRAALKQAKLFTKLAEAEQIKLVNKILLEAAKDYWQWYFSYYNYRLLSRSTDIATEIFRRVKLDASFGEASAIDTVQAKITLQQRLVERQESYLEFLNSGIRISIYLWNNAGYPVQLPVDVAPVLSPTESQLLSTQTLNELIFLAKQNHPELVKLRTKIDQLEIERKLASEYLKPRLDLNYNFINQPLMTNGTFNSISVGKDYKFGLDFSMPLFLRKERAKLALTKVKIQSTQWEQSQAEREILNQINIVYNQIVNTNQILRQQTDVAENYTRLLQAELINLENGESDLFKINVQQEKLIQAQSKLLKLKAEYEKMKATMYWAAGVRNLNYNANQD
ncbi:MAG: TolC family protein [Cyclobacteriaceae bacterium]|jgi:outer membrane protein TolC|nr:TolC family protein [Flammeovirgaceae bacterium]